MGLRYPHEYLFGNRVYTVIKSKNGDGNVYGIAYFEKKLIGKKITILLVPKEDTQFLEVVKREYKKKKNRSERGLKK